MFRRCDRLGGAYLGECDFSIGFLHFLQTSVNAILVFCGGLSLWNSKICVAIFTGRTTLSRGVGDKTRISPHHG